MDLIHHENMKYCGLRKREDNEQQSKSYREYKLREQKWILGHSRARARRLGGVGKIC